MNRAEAELLMDVVDSFTNSIMRRKMLDEQRAERAQREILQREAMGRQDYQFGEQMKRDDARMAQDKEYKDKNLALQEQAMVDRASKETADTEYQDKNLKMQESIRSIQEGIRKDANATRQLDQLNATFANIERGVREGSISPEEGNRQAASIYNSMKTSFEAMIGLTPFAAFANGQDVQLFKAPPMKPAEPKPVGKEIKTSEDDNGVTRRFERDLYPDDLKAEQIREAEAKVVAARQQGPMALRQAMAELAKLKGESGQAAPAAPAKSRFQINVVK